MKAKSLKQEEWSTQWRHFRHTGKSSDGKEQQHFLQYVIKPYSLDDFRDKVVLDAGCGSGDKLTFLSPYVKKIIGIDLNTSAIIQEILASRDESNIDFIEGDLATIEVTQALDIIVSDGVIHHTEDPMKTFLNLYHLLEPGGLIMIMVYSKEGNRLNRVALNRISSCLLQKLPHRMKHFLSIVLAANLRIYGNIVHSLKLKHAPFYLYLCDYFLKMSREMNVLDIYDQINAPVVHYISHDDIKDWFSKERFTDVHVSHAKGVTWIANGRKNHM